MAIKSPRLAMFFVVAVLFGGAGLAFTLLSLAVAPGAAGLSFRGVGRAPRAQD